MNRLTVLTIMAALLAQLLLPSAMMAQFGSGTQPASPGPRLWLNATAIEIVISDAGVSRVDSTTMSFANAGSADLKWRLYFGSDFGGCAVEIAYNWIDVSPSGGTLAPRARTAAEIHVLNAPAAAELGTALLCLATNDPRAALVAIPVTVYAK